MGPIFKGAAVVCLVALSGLQPAAGALQFSVETAGRDAYSSVNLARVGHMSVRIGVLTEDSTLADGLKTAFTAAREPLIAASCDQAIAKLKEKKFTALFTNAEDRNYRQAVQKALDAGLGELKSYPETETEEKWTEFWAKPDGANLAHLLSSNSTKVGCAIGTCAAAAQEYRTSQSATFLFCQMEPAAVKDKAPFDKEYYEALTERKTPLTEMTEEDLKAPVQGAAAAAVPSLLVAGLTAIVAFASA